MAHPDFRKLLPSKVKQYLSEYFIRKLETSELDFLTNPVYKLSDAIREFRDIEGIAPGLVVGLYREALKEYNTKHPLGWDNENQKAFRHWITKK